MKNYWLSEFAHQVDDETSDDSEETDPKSNLNDRQKMLYDQYETIADEFGMFNKSSKADGAHYATAANNPFKDSGLVCSNCVFYMKNSCEIVSGKIEPEAICKLWIIPQELIK